MGIATSQIYLMQKFNKEIMLPKLLKRKHLELIFYNWTVSKRVRIRRLYYLEQIIWFLGYVPYDIIWTISRVVRKLSWKYRGVKKF